VDWISENQLFLRGAWARGRDEEGEDKD